MFYIRLGYGFAIIMEDIGGKRLKSVIPHQGFSIDTFLEIANQIGTYLLPYVSPNYHLYSSSPVRTLTGFAVQGLDAVHSAGVMHKDLNPMNIVVNMETKALNIIDFDLASQMSTNEVNTSKYKIEMREEVGCVSKKY